MSRLHVQAEILTPDKVEAFRSKQQEQQLPSSSHPPTSDPTDKTERLLPSSAPSSAVSAKVSAAAAAAPEP
jgi:hypothetical protein